MTQLLESSSATPPRSTSHLSDAPLDRRVAHNLGTDAPWVRASLAPVIAVLLLAVVIPLVVIGAGWPRHGNVAAAYGLVGECILGVVILLSAAAVAGATGGWQRAFGLCRPNRDDGREMTAWTGIQVGVRIALSIVLVAAIPALRHHHSGNLTGVHTLGVGGVVMLATGAVLVAPFVEEIAFRGVMLRGLMRRMSFWPAAVLSSLVFALLHAPTASSGWGVIVVVVTIYAFGLLQCLLVRRTGRLAPAMGVHAVTNALVLALALAVGS